MSDEQKEEVVSETTETVVEETAESTEPREARRGSRERRPRMFSGVAETPPTRASSSSVW